MNTVFEEHDGKQQEEQGGCGDHKYQPPPPPGPLFAAGNSKGGWGGPSFQPPPPPGPLLRYLSSEMGGPGAGGRTCEMALRCRRGRIFSKTMLSPAPEHDFHTSCAQSRQGRSGANDAGRVKWCSGAGEGASFQKSCSRLHQSMISTPHALKVAKGGLGPRGRACEVVLWCRRGRIFSKIMLSPAPERVFLHLMFVNAFLRGRRQLPQAGEVRRPQRAGVVCLCIIRVECFWFVAIAFNETREGRGWLVPSTQPRPPGPAFAIPLERNGGSGAWGAGGWGAGGFWRDCVVCARCRSVACAKWQPLQRFCMGFGEKGVRVVILLGGCVSFECEKWTPYGGFVSSAMLDND